MLGIEIESEFESSGIEIAIWHAYEWKYREMKKATANGLISVCMYVCKYVCKYVERGKEIKSNQIWHAYEWEKYRKKELPNLRMYVCVYVYVYVCMYVERGNIKSDTHGISNGLRFIAYLISIYTRVDHREKNKNKKD